MDFAFSPDQERFRAEVRAFLEAQAARLDDPVRSRGLKGGYSAAFYRSLGAAGYLGLQYPAEYGGASRPPIYETILGEELGRAAAPAGNYAGTVLEFGHTILRHGTEDQRRRYLPPVASGEIRAGHLYTEPDAGSDLAGIRTTATRDGDAYVIRGLKTFASEIGRADYSLLLARTARDGPGEDALTMFVLDDRLPGIDHTRLETTGGKGTHQAYLDGVRVAAEDRVGEEGDGWRIFLAMRLEYWTKNQGYYCGTLQRLVDRLVAFVRTDDGGRRARDPLVRQRLARLATDVAALRLLSYRLASSERPHEEGRLIAQLKVLTDTTILRVGDEAMRIAGPDALLVDGGAAGHAGLSLENRYRENVLKHFSSLGHSFARSELGAVHLGLGPSTPTAAVG